MAELAARDLTYTIDSTTPKGIGGWTILAPFREANANCNEAWFASVCSLVAIYEDFYFTKMKYVITLFNSLSIIARNKEDTMIVKVDIDALITEIDEKFYDHAHACALIIPDAAWLAYKGNSTR